MVRIVYGISGEGSGHSSRAREIMRHLLDEGHEVRAASYASGFRNLRDDFDVFEIVGLHITTRENRVSSTRTFLDNLRRFPEGVRRYKALRDEVFRGFDPEVVITDFEPMTARLAGEFDLPLVTIDNQHRMRYMAYPCPDHLKRDAVLTETVIRAMIPRPDVSLVTTFYFGQVKNDRTFLFPPILRREVLDLEPDAGEHVIVYFTQAFETYLEHLYGFPDVRFVAYGTEREGRDRNVTYRAFSRTGFLDDLAGSRGVIATVGFTLMTESLHLKKPVLALPMEGQFEQELNALLLAEAGYGLNGRARGRDAVEEFLGRLDEFQGRLAGYPSADNSAIEAKLCELLADGAGAVQEARRKRRGG